MDDINTLYLRNIAVTNPIIRSILLNRTHLNHPKHLLFRDVSLNSRLTLWCGRHNELDWFNSFLDPAVQEILGHLVSATTVSRNSIYTPLTIMVKIPAPVVSMIQSKGHPIRFSSAKLSSTVCNCLLEVLLGPWESSNWETSGQLDPNIYAYHTYAIQLYTAWRQRQEGSDKGTCFSTLIVDIIAGWTRAEAALTNKWKGHHRSNLHIPIKYQGLVMYQSY